MQPQDTAGTYWVNRLGTDRRTPLRNRIIGFVVKHWVWNGREYVFSTFPTDRPQVDGRQV